LRLQQTSLGPPAVYSFSIEETTEETTMKILMIATLVSISATTGSAFAQSTSAANNAQPAQSVIAFTNGATPSQDGQWVPPDGQPAVAKTRAQVYRSLVKAEQDGQLSYLNSTLYSRR
jgi:hypothetical protein